MKRSRSLLWRLGALALGVTLLSLVLHVGVIAIWLRPMVNQAIVGLAARAQTVRALIGATAPERRDAVASELARDRFRVLRGAVDAPGQPPPTGSLGPRPFLLAQLGAGFEVHDVTAGEFSFGTRELQIGFAVDGEPWRIELEAQPPIQALLGTGIAWLMLAAAAVAASLLIGLRFIAGPLRQVAARIADQGGALEPLPLPVRATNEVQLLVESFNRLVERVGSADRTKQQLLAGVSHDLRTPLARLRLRIETQCDPAVADAAEEELRAVERIVSQFLAFVHGDSGAGLGADASLRDTAAAVVASYAERGHDVRWLAAAGDIRVGSVGLQRLVSNLIDNALAHGRPPIDVTWRDAVEGGTRELGVWDRGAGLTDAEFRQACEPFVRLSKSAEIGHCGLGLAIVAQIAQQSGARLSCRHDDAGRFGIVVAWHASGEAPGRSERVTRSGVEAQA